MENDQEKAKNEYINNLWTDYTYSITQFDNQILYISSGALGLSLTFIKDITPIEKSIHLWIFITSLVLFTFSILLSFLCHYISSEKIMKRIKDVQKEDYSQTEEKWIPRLNKYMLFSLILGIVTLVIFSSINIYKMNDNEPKKPMEDINHSSSNIGVPFNKGFPVRPIPQSVSASTGTTTAQTGTATTQNTSTSDTTK